MRAPFHLFPSIRVSSRVVGFSLFFTCFPSAFFQKHVKILSLPPLSYGKRCWALQAHLLDTLFVLLHHAGNIKYQLWGWEAGLWGLADSPCFPWEVQGCRSPVSQMPRSLFYQLCGRVPRPLQGCLALWLPFLPSFVTILSQRLLFPGRP